MDSEEEIPNPSCVDIELRDKILDFVGFWPGGYSLFLCGC